MISFAGYAVIRNELFPNILVYTQCHMHDTIYHPFVCGIKRRVFGIAFTAFYMHFFLIQRMNINIFYHRISIKNSLTPGINWWPEFVYKQTLSHWSAKYDNHNGINHLKPKYLYIVRYRYNNIISNNDCIQRRIYIFTGCMPVEHFFFQIN